MILYGIQNCDTVRKAKHYLQVHQIPFEFVDLRKNPIDEATLNHFVAVAGWDKVLNKRATTYRNLSAFEKANLTPQVILDNPTLIKRPVLVVNHQVIVGFSAEQYGALLID